MSLKSIELLPTDVKNFSINLPGSKSISNRVLLLSSLSEGLTNISNLLFSEDTQIMIDALKKLGINIIESKNNNECKVIGKKNSFITKEADIYVGNAGTVIRPLTASLAFNDGDYKLYGSKYTLLSSNLSKSAAFCLAFSGSVSIIPCSYASIPLRACDLASGVKSGLDTIASLA